LVHTVELLSAPGILAELQDARRTNLNHLELLFDVDSTNTRLLGAAPPPRGRADVCLSELQHAGRGRRGRRWIAPFGCGLAFSLGWSCSDAIRTLPALSLGVGVAVSRALVRAGASGVVLKWPNDIWFMDRKIGGVLIELRAQTGGLTHVVIGIGLNVTLPAGARHEIEASGVSVAAVADACARPPSRNCIAGAILDELLSMLAEYEQFGFSAFRDAWSGLDALRGRRAQVMVGETATLGIARGVDVDGALLLETAGQMQRFHSGEASLRLIHG
jgi:BirA family biotin operon repressor/biotin-[acetyl-CoA-carboxylase] ligase